MNTKVSQTTLDWSKPIRFAGRDEPIELMDANTSNFRGKPYAVRRLNEANPYTAVWFYAADGKGSRPENDIVNV